MELLRVSADRRHLETEHGERFYLLGDTAWELFHRLSREEASFYLKTRAEQGFNMIQAVVLAEFDGIRTANAYGRLPLKKNANGVFDPTLPDLGGDYSYFDHVEYILTEAERLGLYIGLLPTWGDKFNKLWGVGPEIFDKDNAFTYAKWLASRVCHHRNILWILGGDRPLTEKKHFDVVEAMARGIREVCGSQFLITYHPNGACSSSAFLAGADWLDFHMYQSGHGWPTKPCYELMAESYACQPIKPVMDGEPCYEDHAINFKEENGYFDAVDVRLAALRNLFSGACGNTYGHSSVWGMQKSATKYWPNTWKTALFRPAALWQRVYGDFIRAHDLTKTIPCPSIVKSNLHDANYVAAMKGEGEAWLYIPYGAPVEIDTQVLSFTPASVYLYEPVTGALSGHYPFPADGVLFFEARGAGRGMDAIIRLEK